jgi:molecular chaperone Hsp33
MPDSSTPSDRVLRAVTHDGNFRVMAARTTEMVRGVVRAQKVSVAMQRQVAEILTATVLVRESMAPDLRMQAIVQSQSRKSRFVADSHPNGLTRGLLTVGDPNEPLVGPGTVLQIQRTLSNGSLHQGIVGFPDEPDENTDATRLHWDQLHGSASTIRRTHPVASLFMHYMQESEQIVTMMSVGCLEADGVISECGGYVVQLLPEVERGKLAVMAERLEDFRDLSPLLAKGLAAPETLLTETLWGMPHDQVAERDVSYGCLCSQERLLASLTTLPRKDLLELASQSEPLEINCEFCGHDYAFLPIELRGLLDAN